jgi:hypothetical protein
VNDTVHRPRLSPLAASALAVLAIACGSSGLPLPEGAFRVQDPGLSEMSGLEASPDQPGVLWSINDSGSRPLLYRLGIRGENLGRVSVGGTNWFRNDWETLAFWREGDTTWLLIGDVGDNKGRRDHVNIYALREPVAGQERADVAWMLSFRYPDGARDAEGIAIDPLSGDVLVLSKRDKRQRLYRVPLSARGADEPVLAELITELPPLSALATGLDISRDGRAVAVLTYRGLYVWRHAVGEDWATVFSRPPVRTELPAMAKAEAMTFGADSNVVYVGSERVPTPLIALRLE